jgi:hypothetical protein
VGDPLPPALNIPIPVADLSAVQRGDTLLIRFTAPSLTTEQLPIRGFERVDIRVGETMVPVPVPEPGSAVTAVTPAAPYAGKDVLVTVRLVSNRGREAEWSNAVALTPRSPLPVPVVTAAQHPGGVELRWPGTEGAKYRVRKGTDEVATVEKPTFVDAAVELGKTYTYDVQTVIGPVESEISKPVSITVRDAFAPAAPAGLTAVAGVNAIELVWERNAEPDLAGYRVYRAEGAGEFAVLADAVEGLAYSDRQIESGKTYRYRVSAIDRSGNESPHSTVVEVATP